jgi:hypothetical protein
MRGEQKSAERLVAERLALEEWRKTDECHGHSVARRADETASANKAESRRDASPRRCPV